MADQALTTPIGFETARRFTLRPALPLSGDLVEGRLEIPGKSVRILNHREMPELRHFHHFCAFDPARQTLRVLNRGGVIVATGEEVGRDALAVDSVGDLFAVELITKNFRSPS